MSALSREAMMELMAYADGELDDVEATARVESLVKTSDEARAVVAAMRSLGDVVRELPEARGVEAGAVDSIADAVMAKVEREARAPEPSRHSHAPVIELASARARRTIGRAHYASAAVAALALAAGVALFLRSSGAGVGPVASDDPHETMPVLQPAPGATEVAPSPAASVAQNDPNGDKNDVDLEEVESQDHHMSVFYVPKSITGAAAAAHAGASVVVWIDDHGGH